GRAAEDQVARRQLPRRRQVFDDLADVPDQLADRALLAEDAVDLERDPRLGAPPALGGAAHRADRRRVVEALADLPGPAELLRLALQVAPRHVEADGVAPDALHRIGGLDLAPAGAGGA